MEQHCTCKRTPGCGSHGQRVGHGDSKRVRCGIASTTTASSARPQIAHAGCVVRVAGRSYVSSDVDKQDTLVPADVHAHLLLGLPDAKYAAPTGAAAANTEQQMSAANVDGAYGQRSAPHATSARGSSSVTSAKPAALSAQPGAAATAPSRGSSGSGAGSAGAQAAASASPGVGAPKPRVAAAVSKSPQKVPAGRAAARARKAVTGSKLVPGGPSSALRGWRVAVAGERGRRRGGLLHGTVAQRRAYLEAHGAVLADPAEQVRPLRARVGVCRSHLKGVHVCCDMASS